jgi:iron only hydrogenase large subunit-like protein
MFSGIVKIADIDDYITPSQNCIKPLISEKLPEEVNSNNTKKPSKITFTLEDDSPIYQEPDLIKIKDKSTKSAKVSLNDCLACNGCVTTAETLLIEAQSVDEFLKNSLFSNDKYSLVCISPQSILSLANYYNIPQEECFIRLCKIFQKAGVKHVFNFNSFINFTLQECYKEFKNRILDKNSLPIEKEYLMCSECPGWVCYAEKKIGEWVIPKLSKVKSPQQLIGHLLKNIFRTRIKDQEIYVTCVMPCFDKKLEATRESHRVNNNLEVDTVISTIELLDLFEKLNINFLEEKEILPEESIYMPTSQLFSGYFESPNLQGYTCLNAKDEIKIFFNSIHNFTSNSYTEFIMRQYCKEFLKDKPFKIEYKLGKNSDFKEVLLIEENSSKPILSFGMVYGFRNIQNIIRNKNKIKQCYLEIMACPGGCINGGGQMRPRNNNESSRDVLKRIEEEVISTIEKELDKGTYNILLNHIEQEASYIYSYIEKFLSQDILFTEFKALDKNSGLSLKW